LEANFLFSRGRYEEALVPYFKALDHEDAAPYAEYGIGLIFHSLEEGMQALLRYSNSKKLLERFTNNEHRELRYRNHYNSGIVLFEEGEYQLAAASFREALRTDPRSMDAKRNLELTLISITTETTADNSSGRMQEQREILFDYLRFEEQQQWRSREWTPEENYSGPDY
jgi:Ca-activated chloride channel family protein